MEEFVFKWVWDIVQSRVYPNQYGSIKKSSTTHALVDLLHQCYTSTDASKQYARILLLCSTQSDWNYIHGGVPQGTKLGPVLFVLMINDLQTKCDSYKYVDDTCIVYTGSDSQAPNLQEAADAAYLWTIQNDMKINKRKTRACY